MTTVSFGRWSISYIIYQLRDFDYFFQQFRRCPIIFYYSTYVDSENDKRRNVSMSGGYGYGGGFALIVVLFILLIIVGASWY